MHRVWRILSIDGGGIRGIIPALILAQLEDMTGLQAAQMFDVIAGTSVGGILAMGLATQKAAGKSTFKAAEIADLFIDEGPRIFHNPASWLANVMRAKYATGGLERLFDLIFADARLKDLVTDVLVPCYDIKHRCPIIFRSRWARRRPRYDLPAREVARAASAAPTIFNPAHLRLPGNRETVHVVDGGVFANSPCMYAYIDARAILAEEGDDFLVVSLGAGESNKPLTPQGVKDWGMAQWSRPMLELVSASNSEAVHAQMKLLLPPKDDQRYYRFQVDIPEQSDGTIDNVSKKNIEGLIRAADSVVENPRTADDLKRLSERLIKLHVNQGVSGALPSLTSAIDRHCDRRVFICSAEDDREAVAQPLASALAARGLEPTLSQSAISEKCSIRRVITEASKTAPFGIVVLSREFLANEWAEKQVGWLCARLIGGENLLLAIAHGFSKETDVQSVISALHWNFEAQTSLEGVLELVHGFTSDGIEPLADTLTEEIINWYS